MCRLRQSALAGMAGLEPTISESKSGVLPLHYIPPSKLCAKRPVSRPLVRVGWEMGLEPTTPGTTIRCSYQLSYTHHSWSLALARQEGLEPPAYCLEGSCSIQLSYWRMWPEQQYRRNAPASLDIVTSAARFVNIFGNFSLGAQRRESALCKSAIYRRCCERR